jgi:hypothetical protein
VTGILPDERVFPSGGRALRLVRRIIAIKIRYALGRLKYGDTK